MFPATQPVLSVELNVSLLTRKAEDSLVPEHRRSSKALYFTPRGHMQVKRVQKTDRIG